MTITCPACGKINGIEDMICSRCACGLEKLARITRLAVRCHDGAAARLRAADGPGAMAQAQKSWDLRHSPESARLAFLAALLNGDFTAASHWYRIRGQVLHCASGGKGPLMHNARPDPFL